MYDDPIFLDGSRVQDNLHHTDVIVTNAATPEVQDKEEETQTTLDRIDGEGESEGEMDEMVGDVTTFVGKRDKFYDRDLFQFCRTVPIIDPMPQELTSRIQAALKQKNYIVKLNDSYIDNECVLIFRHSHFNFMPPWAGIRLGTVLTG